MKVAGILAEYHERRLQDDATFHERCVRSMRANELLLRRLRAEQLD